MLGKYEYSVSSVSMTFGNNNNHGDLDQHDDRDDDHGHLDYHDHHWDDDEEGDCSAFLGIIPLGFEIPFPEKQIVQGLDGKMLIIMMIITNHNESYDDH